MKHRRNYMLFGILGLLGAAVLFVLLITSTNWPWLVSWMIAASVAAFVFYGIDKGLSKTNARRIPELILHLMSLLGGFVGALLGMLVFRHKTNFREHPLFIPIMVVSAVLWGFLLYQFVLRA